MLKSQNASNLRDKDMVYVMEISLRWGYNEITQLIANFNYQNYDATPDPKQQPKYKKQNAGTQSSSEEPQAI